MLTIDGSYGEGGGQILRSTLTLSAVTGRAVHLTRIRANRSSPGLHPQHLTAVRAAAAVCSAELEGDALDSQTLTFVPQSPPQAGDYTFDVTEVAGRGSAGSVTLVLQTVLLPLALAGGKSTLTLRGGTAVPMSPPAPYIEKVYIPTLFELGVRARIDHRRWGFYPRGGGELVAEVTGGDELRGRVFGARGPLNRVEGLAFAANLPSHIPQRMTNRARSLLREAEMETRIEPRHVPSPGTGTGLFLCARYDPLPAGFLMLGRRGLPSEEVAEIACRALFAHHETGTVADMHLADQLVLPFALAKGPSHASVSKVTRHLQTNVWVAHQFGFDALHLEGEMDEPGTLSMRYDA
jgi:RNA 3'-terminal phosphate cyclase (ATP)